jgi:hypothetical protein
MRNFLPTTYPRHRRIASCIAMAVAGLLILDRGPTQAAPPATSPSAAPLTNEVWQSAPLAVAEPGEIDRLIARELQASGLTPALLTTDEQFVRRVTLDLTGQLPVPADVTDFVADHDPAKRVRLIDRLLDSDEYVQHWAEYWRDVIAARVTDPRGRLLTRAFELWMADQLKNNRGWDTVVRALLTAEGTCRQDDDGQHGANYFLASHRGPDAANERAAETARIFLGIQIQCAQCHDHPFDSWKRHQFHELAAYFARVREQLVRNGQSPPGIALVSLPRGEHQMPSKEDPRQGTVMQPRFLDGRSPGADLPDRRRRQALADAIVDGNDPWFAAAYVNRVWGELMGQSFYQPVDDMGPKKEAVLVPVLARLSSSFRASSYDVKQLFRTILNSQTYQRQARLGESADQHLHFAAAYPTRLPADSLWESLVGVLGNLGGPRPQPGQGMGALAGIRPGLEGLFKREFDFDPSTKPDEVEGSIPQALLMMNNPAINGRIQATGTNLLARILKAYPEDDAALRMLYLRTLARKPTDGELRKCRAYLQKTANRREAFEDILWALLNSTEFQTKR